MIDPGATAHLHETFYTVVVEGPAGPGDAFVQVFFTWAGTIGGAIAKVMAVAKKKEGMENPIPSEADEYDYKTLPDDVVEIPGTAVFTSGVRYGFPADEPVFRIPAGVILSCLEGEYDPEELFPGFRRYEEGELLCLDCVVPEGGVEETFLSLAAILPGIRVAWVECSDEWDEATTRRLYTNEDLNSPEAVRSFLRREADNVLRNGMVKFTVYGEAGQTNLLLEDHKEIRVLTYSEEIRDAMAEALRGLGFEESGELRAVSRGLHHWHYAPSEALCHRDFVAHLLGHGFSLWKEIPAGE